MFTLDYLLKRLASDSLNKGNFPPVDPNNELEILSAVGKEGFYPLFDPNSKIPDFSDFYGYRYKREYLLVFGNDLLKTEISKFLTKISCCDFGDSDVYLIYDQPTLDKVKEAIYSWMGNLLAAKIYIS